MEKEEITITITFDYDPNENNGMPGRNFLYHYLTRLNREVPIKSIVYKDVEKVFDEDNKIEDIPLKEVDSIDDKDVPEKPDMSDVTVLPETVNRQVAEKLEEEK